MIDEKMDSMCETEIAAQNASPEPASTDVAQQHHREAVLPAEDQPVRVRLTPWGVELTFFHASRAVPPFTLMIPRGQWEQMARLIAYPPPGVRDFEAFVGFTQETLALHGIDAVEAGGNQSGSCLVVPNRATEIFAACPDGMKAIEVESRRTRVNQGEASGAREPVPRPRGRPAKAGAAAVAGSQARSSPDPVQSGSPIFPSSRHAPECWKQPKNQRRKRKYE